MQEARHLSIDRLEAHRIDYRLLPGDSSCQLVSSGVGLTYVSLTFRRSTRWVQLVLLLAWAGRGNEAGEEHVELARHCLSTRAQGAGAGPHVKPVLVWQLNVYHDKL